MEATVEQYSRKLEAQQAVVGKLRERMSTLNAQRRRYLAAINELQAEYDRAAAA